MPNITEQDIIEHLENKIQYHYKEARRIENILLAFQTGGDMFERTKGAGERIKLKSKLPDSIAENKTRKIVEIPEAFSSGLKLNSKVIYALNEIKNGFVEDIAIKMAELQPDLDADKVKVQISGVLSSLKKKGILNTEKRGRKDMFSINQNILNR